MATPEREGIVPSRGDDDDGVSLGTMKLPPNDDLQRFEFLHFHGQTAFAKVLTSRSQCPSLSTKCRSFITIGDGETEVLLHIDCLVFLTEDGSSLVFKTIRNGPLKDHPPPREPRIIRSLLHALQKSIEIATVK